MGGIFAQIIGGGVGQLVKDVVGTFKLSPAAKLELDKELAAHEQELKLKDYEFQAKILEAQTKEIEAASANIRAEASSGDPFTSRARPTFFYLNYVFLPIAQMIKGIPITDLKPIEFPDIMWEIFVAGFLGYTAARSYEKITSTRSRGGS